MSEHPWEAAVGRSHRPVAWGDRVHVDWRPRMPSPSDLPFAQATYSDEEAAALYDVLNPWGLSDDFYLALVMSATSVLDVGCGTGALLHRAREVGHRGRLCGLDPDHARLGVARFHADIEWVTGTAASIPWAGEFDLALMAGHAFQELVDDNELRASLAAIRRALVDGGRFAFETRNPLARVGELE
jgi:SAM-dependent methyltransferase